MAFGISPVIPLQRDDTDGFYSLTKTLAQNIQQNFKNLVLTAPGERVMIPDFGVGLRNYLFESNELSTQSEIAEKINEQVNTYMPFINIDDLEFHGDSEQILAVRIFYSVPSVSLSNLTLSIEL
tara:strand:- start:25057 stop:25428 length:372 start_codon:yes stop_codon:yes gene_type:complete